MKKKIMCFLLASIFCFSAVGMLGGCGNDKIQICNNEYFIYWADYEDNEIHIIGLTDTGKEQEFLVIPEEIDGMNVIAVGCHSGLTISKIKEKYGDEKYAQFQSEKLRKVFFVSHVNLVQEWSGTLIIQSPIFEAVLFIPNSNDIWKNLEVKSYRTSEKGIKYGIKDQVLNDYDYAANVSYYYNYESAPNDGYYWIDNYGYGETIEYIPEQPIRDGYTFDGWYKEPECINKWNFETDTLPQAQRDEEGKELYQETKLYAKWI